MPLTPTTVSANAQDDLQAIGVWMLEPDRKPIRVLITFETLCQLDQNKIADRPTAWEMFDKEVERILAAASAKYDHHGPDEGVHEGKSLIWVRADDLPAAQPA